ncbi:MAG TPA: hypothetical protein VFA03_02045 [Acetobacteraceae bacterium]|nr:hypothetical protein [Acetobacteraceae bacterium]
MRRRVMAWGALALTAGALAALAAHMRRDVPPDCRDPRTLALVRHSLVEHFGLPPETRIAGIRTVAGGPLAFQFVCEADLENVDLARLPSGARPGFVRYTSRLKDHRRLHDVTVEILPLLFWQKVY